jgi:diphosphomevalonate decarboxylase
MHACMMASRPPIVYWRGATLDVVHAVWRLRAEGLRGYVTSDAGPHVKVLCAEDQADELAVHLRSVAGVHAVDVVGPGPDPTVEVFA